MADSGAGVGCPKFGHPVKISDIYLSNLSLTFAWEKWFLKIVNELLFLKLFQITNGNFNYIRCMPTASTNSVLSA